MYERYLLSLVDQADELDDWDDPEERYYREEVDDGEGALESRDPGVDHPRGTALRIRPEREPLPLP